MSQAGRSRFARVVWPLAIAETFLWASTYYVFVPLLPRWEIHFGWSKTAIAGAFTTALLCSALAAPLIGAQIDRGRGRSIMGVGGSSAAAALALLSRVDGLWEFYALWVVLGLSHAACLYEPCFAILTRLFAAEAKRAITTVALVAGLAGTVSFPAGHFLSQWLGWQSTLLIFSLAAALSTLTASRCLAGMDAASPRAARRPGARSELGLALRKPLFWLLATSYATISLNHGALLPHLLPLLAERGIGQSMAVLTASMIGPMQVVGRLGMLAIERRVTITAISYLCFALMALASLALLGAGAAPLMLAVFVLFQGAGYGVTSITRPGTTALFLGRAGFGAISGALALPFMAATALAPTLAALLWTLGGYRLVIVCTFLAALLGLATLAAAARLARR